MAEIVVAIGFISIITTALLAVAGKGLQLSQREVDIAGAHQHCEALMEEISFQAGRAESWDALASISTPQYPKAADGSAADSQDREFTYTLSVVEVGSELKRVQVRVYIARSNSEFAAADTRRPKGGEVLRMTNFYPRP
jgi:type II secretory pathway pseudopilin PulG